jgi:succinyl-diaminopimelate desuccinylase
MTNSVNPPGNERKVAETIAKKLEENGIECNLRSLGPDRAYLTARIKGKGNKKSLAFSGHMDTVPPGNIPWDYDPFGGQEVDGKLYGRGASDMKSGLAALAMAMVEIAREGIPLEGDLVLAATAGEEVDTLGAKTMIEDGVLKDVGAMLIGEPSNNELFIAHKGALWLEITSYGKTAHGSMPDQGINAIEHMNTFINALHDKFGFKFKEDKLLGGPTMNLGVISGGVNTNVVPDVCRLQIDMRTVPGMEHSEIIADIKGLMKEIENGSTAKFDLKCLTT